MSFAYCRSSQECKDNDVPIDNPTILDKLKGFVTCSVCSGEYILDDYYKNEAIEEIYTEHESNRKLIKVLVNKVDKLEKQIEKISK